MIPCIHRHKCYCNKEICPAIKSIKEISKEFGVDMHCKYYEPSKAKKFKEEK